MADGAAAIEIAEPDARSRLVGLFTRWDSASAPGLAVGIRHRGDDIFRQAYGMASLEARRALTPRSRIRIGSTSKHMTALLALLLAEDGLIDLDAPLRTWLPELTGPEGEGTLRQHCQHRAGGRCYFDLSVIAHLDAIPPAGRALDLARRQTGRNFPPGSAMIYCNSSYHLLALAIERAGRAPFETLLYDRLFAPLGMHDTASIPDDRDIVPGMATLHVPAPGGGWRRGLFPNPDVRGEGAVISTIDDMLIWTAHLLSRDRFGTAESWRQLLERPVYPDGATGKYALGLIHGEHRGRAVIYHAGGVIGGLSQMLIFPNEALEIVILANGAPEADPAALAMAAADIVLGESEGAIDTATAPRELAGSWASHATGMIYHLVADQAGLRLGVVGGPQVVPLTPESGGTWIAEPPTLSPLEIDPAGLAEGAITIRFGGETACYHPRCDGARPERLPERLLSAPDAEAAARFERTEACDLLHLSDPFGTNTIALDWHDHRIALATATKPGLPYTAAILLDADGAAFTLNTARTRWLRFT